MDLWFQTLGLQGRMLGMDGGFVVEFIAVHKYSV